MCNISDQPVRGLGDWLWDGKMPAEISLVVTFGLLAGGWRRPILAVEVAGRAKAWPKPGTATKARREAWERRSLGPKPGIATKAQLAISQSKA